MSSPTGPRFQPPDYSILAGTGLDRTMFYPRRESWPPLPGAEDHQVPVAEGIALGCRFYVAGREGPVVLFFHGNGEVAADYDDIAPLYTGMGASLFVADYRGYGTSGGTPSFAAMMADCHPVLRYLQDFMASRTFTGRCHVMGRSLGAHSAVELAAHYPEALAGLIIESGTSSVARMAQRLAEAGRPAEAAELEAQHLEKLRAITLPTLVLHGEWDEMIPVSRAKEFYDTLTTPRKRMVTIPQAGHNDILWVGQEPYLAALQRFLFRPRGNGDHTA